MSWDSRPKTWVDGSPIGAYDLNREVRDRITYLFNDTYATRQVLFHSTSYVVTGNAIAVVQDTAQNDLFIAYQNAAANGDVFKTSVVLSPGRYRLRIRSCTDTDCGIFKVSIDGVEMTTDCDEYTASTTHNAERWFYIWNTTELKRHLAVFTVTGKNAASSGYRLKFSTFLFEPYPTEV